MAPIVYLARGGHGKDVAQRAAALGELLRATPLLSGIKERDLTGIKLTFGEAGNRGCPAPAVVREVVSAARDRRARPFLTETNTLYSGRRKNTIDHLELAREHGFTHESIGAPIFLGDGLLGREGFRQATDAADAHPAHLAPVVRDMDYLIGLAHLTGHLLCGFGAAIKNIGMGLANRAGKLEMHSAISPAVKEDACILCLRCVAACAAQAIREGARAVAIDRRRCTGCAECLAVCPTGAMGVDWSPDTRRVQERMAEYACAVVHAVRGRCAFINLLYGTTRHCDCLGEAPEVIAPDVGIAASLDPVALDQASLDLVAAASAGDPFRRAWPETDPEAQIRHAETLGLGTRRYDLVEIPSVRA